MKNADLHKLARRKRWVGEQMTRFQRTSPVEEENVKLFKIFDKNKGMFRRLNKRLGEFWTQQAMNCYLASVINLKKGGSLVECELIEYKLVEVSRKDLTKEMFLRSK